MSANIALKDMTDSQKQAKFEAYMQRQESAKGKNAAKRDAINKLKANNIDEFNILLAAAQKEHGVTLTPDSSDDE